MTRSIAVAAAYALLTTPASACPPGIAEVRIDGTSQCARVDSDRAEVFDRAGALVEEGRLDGDHRQGWWTRFTHGGEVAGQTLYESGTPVRGLLGPREAPRCLDQPPPDGRYALTVTTPVCQAGLGPDCHYRLEEAPVAVVGGCVATGIALSEGGATGVHGRDRFLGVVSDARRCNSGVTVEYRVTPAGLSEQAQTWTTCGGGDSAYGPHRMLSRDPVVADGREAWVALLVGPDPVVAAAALERIALEQPDEWSCDPLTTALSGALGEVVQARAVAMAVTPCLAEPLRHHMVANRNPAAARALAPMTTSQRQAERDLLAAVEAGNHGGVVPLSRAVLSFDDDPSDRLRQGLSEVLLDPDGTQDQRQGARVALDRLFRTAEHGEASFEAASGGAGCEGWSELLRTEAMRAWLAQVPASELASVWGPVAERCERTRHAALDHLMARLDGHEAPDDAWALLAELLSEEVAPGPWPASFAGWTCTAAPDPGWGPGRSEAMEILRARRCVTIGIP